MSPGQSRRETNSFAKVLDGLSTFYCCAVNTEKSVVLPLCTSAWCCWW